jgi:D-alanyl-D-alanine carboxypeptidase
MTGLKTHLGEALTAAVKRRGFAGASVIRWPGAEPCSVWVPESPYEPAFLVYSITKTFTATLILQLCDEGTLDLDTPVARWFPRLSDAERISIRRLLNHTAGLPDYGPIRAYHEAVRSSPTEPWSFDRFAAETFEKGLLFRPGQGWAYSNPAYMLAKRIAEEVTGLFYRDLVSERLARPLGLTRTFVPESLEDLAPLAPGASALLSLDRSPREVRQYYHPGWVSHGVVASTPSEIARFMDGLFRGDLLLRRMLDQMLELTPLSTASEPDVSAQDFPLRPGIPSYGLGLMGDPASPWGLLVGHNGGGPCYSASAFHAFDLHGTSVCAIGAIEEGFTAEGVVASVLDYLLTVHSTSPA